MKRDPRYAQVVGLFLDSEKALNQGDVASAAACASEAARCAANLADELRFEQGVAAGIARAEAAKKKKKRKQS